MTEIDLSKLNILHNDEDLEILAQMDVEYVNKNVSYFVSLLNSNRSITIRVRSVCILAEVGDETAVEGLSKIMLKDPNHLVRHESAFSLGQLGFSTAVSSLVNAMLNDENNLVRHEAASALGSIGDESARAALVNATSDPDEVVSQSAVIALVNLDYLLTKH